MKAYLKIKITSLAAEATLIRKEERRHNVGHRGRVRARRLLAKKPNDLTATQRRHLERALIPPSTDALKTFWGLRDHRTGKVREEARAAQIAYGYLNGLAYKQIENKAKTEPDWKRVCQLIEKYGNYGPGIGTKVDNWKDVA